MPRRASDNPDIIFLNGCPEGESKRYRVYNLIEGLSAWGYSVEVIDFGQCRQLIERRLVPKVVIMFRAVFDPSSGVVELLDYLRWNGVRTVFDVDDYVFEPNIVNEVAGINHFSQQQRRQYEWGVRAYRSLMFCCERTTAATPFLVDRMRELGREAYLIPNSVNTGQCEIASELLRWPKPNDGHVRICYMSGSATHHCDFLEAEAAIQDVLQRHPNVVFRLVGLLHLNDSWKEFGNRVERMDFMPSLDLIETLYESHINVAPLEEGNPFCEGKSELKFFEAGLVDVPTVASRTGTYVNAIEDGKTGFLASGRDEWTSKLEQLVLSSDLRARLGNAARQVAITRFDVETAAHHALLAYGLIESIPSRPRRREDGLKIGWIVPGLIIGGGGHRNILRVAYYLEQFGHDVRLYFSDTDMTNSRLRGNVRRHFYPFRGPIRRFDGKVDGENVLLATHWTTVALAEKVGADVGEIMYFVQDFEPAFYPMGSEYILAENTYMKGFYGISSGSWCETILRRNYGMEVDHFRFPIDRRIYHAADQARVNRLIFFAKPEMPRRCFQLGVEALAELHALDPSLEIMFYGSPNAAGGSLSFPVTYSGVLPTISDLADLYRTARVGIAFSTTNPSLVPYEMMACGLPVVDLDRPGNGINYGDRDDIALLAGPDPKDLAKAIYRLLHDQSDLDRRGAAGIAFTNGLPTEEEMARQVERLIVDRYRNVVSAAA